MKNEKKEKLDLFQTSGTRGGRGRRGVRRWHRQDRDRVALSGDRHRRGRDRPGRRAHVQARPERYRVLEREGRALPRLIA